MTQWLIDEMGKVWPGQTHPILRDDTGFDAIAYAVSELGFIRLELLADAMKVSLRPNCTTWAAMIEAFYLIANNRLHRVVLIYGPEHPPEIFGRNGDAIRRIESLVEAAPRRPQPLSRHVDDRSTARVQPIARGSHR